MTPPRPPMFHLVSSGDDTVPHRPPVHRPLGIAPKAPHVPFERGRGSSTVRGYGQDWRRVRAQVLAQEPLCRMCMAQGRVTEATEMHHEVSIRADSSRRLDPANLIPTCKPCHLATTGRDGARAKADAR